MDTHYNVDGPGTHDSQGEKPDTHTTHIVCKSINAICPEQAHPERENGLMVARGWGGCGQSVK